MASKPEMSCSLGKWLLPLECPLRHVVPRGPALDALRCGQAGLASLALCRCFGRRDLPETEAAAQEEAESLKQGEHCLVKQKKEQHKGV